MLYHAVSCSIVFLLDASMTLPATIEYLDTRSAATLLGLSPATLASWRSKGRGPAFIKLGTEAQSAIRYSLDDLYSWLRTQTSSITTPNP